MRANRNDFWLFDPASGTRKITDYGLQIVPTLFDQRDIRHGLFQRCRFAEPRPAGSEADLKSTVQSEIFQLPFYPDEGRIKASSTPLKPLFMKEGGFAVSPKVSTDGSLFTFLRTGLRSTYRYDLVVSDMPTGKERTISTTSNGYSEPVIVGGAIYARDLVEDLIYIRKVTQAGQRSEAVVNIDERTVGSLNTVELTIAP